MTEQAESLNTRLVDSVANALGGPDGILHYVDDQTRLEIFESVVVAVLRGLAGDMGPMTVTVWTRNGLEELADEIEGAS